MLSDHRVHTTWQPGAPLARRGSGPEQAATARRGSRRGTAPSQRAPGHALAHSRTRIRLLAPYVLLLSPRNRERWPGGARTRTPEAREFKSGDGRSTAVHRRPLSLPGKGKRPASPPLASTGFRVGGHRLATPAVAYPLPTGSPRHCDFQFHRRRPASLHPVPLFQVFCGNSRPPWVCGWQWKRAVAAFCYRFATRLGSRSGEQNARLSGVQS